MGYDCRFLDSQPGPGETEAGGGTWGDRPGGRDLESTWGLSFPESVGLSCGGWVCVWGEVYSWAFC